MDKEMSEFQEMMEELMEHAVNVAPMLFHKKTESPLHPHQSLTLLAMANDEEHVDMYLKIPGPVTAPSLIVLEFRDSDTDKIVDCYVADIQEFLGAVFNVQAVQEKMLLEDSNKAVKH